MKLLDACPKIYFGKGSLRYLESLPDEKILLVCDPFMVESGIVRMVTDILDGMPRRYSVFSGVEPDPSIETVAGGMQVIFREKPDILIALGGGSAIDATKAILYFCLRYKSSLMGRQYVHKPFFVAIPTTSGTGSEVTSYTVLTDRLNDVKIPLTDRCMTPDAAILCAEFTKTLPRQMAAYTGMDVLTHATEAYVTKSANSFSDMYALEAAQKTFRYLPELFGGSEEEEPHEEMMIASTIAGLAFSNSGLGICHGIAHTIGAEFHLPHGKANSIILPWVIAFNAGLGRYENAGRSGMLARYAQLARRLGFGGDNNAAVRQFVQAVQNLNHLFGTPASLGENGVDRAAFFSQLKESAGKVLKDLTTAANPVAVNEADVELLLTDIYEGNGPL